MRLNHVAAATMCPWGGRLLSDGAGRPWGRGLLVCHCWILETPSSGLVVVDTGFSHAAISHPSSLELPVRALLAPRADPLTSLKARVEALGFTAQDVRHVIVTHLDLDHAGGLVDFPAARVHVARAELDAATSGRVPLRYRAADFAHGPAWSPIDAGGDTWRGLSCVRDLPGLPPEILVLPLPGHSAGHQAVVVRLDGGQHLVHAGDAYFHREDLANGRRTPPLLRLFQELVQVDRAARLANLGRLRELAVQPGVRVHSAHDPSELLREQS